MMFGNREAHGFPRGLLLLLGAGAAGFLVWLSTLPDFDTTEGFWAAIGLLAASGAVLGVARLLSEQIGAPLRPNPFVFLLAFLPALLVSAWVLLVAQPEGGWQQERLERWSGDIGIDGLVTDLGFFSVALAFGIGILVTFVLEPESRAVIVEPEVYEEPETPAPGEHEPPLRDEQEPAPGPVGRESSRR